MIATEVALSRVEEQNFPVFGLKVVEADNYELNYFQNYRFHAANYKGQRRVFCAIIPRKKDGTSASGLPEGTRVDLVLSSGGSPKRVTVYVQKR